MVELAMMGNGRAVRELGIDLAPHVEAGLLHLHSIVNQSAGPRVDGDLHLQNVNAYHARLKTWLRRFNGVASRYLDN